MQAAERRECPGGFETKGVQLLPAEVLGHVREA
jgi:hypothetical protein